MIISDNPNHKVDAEFNSDGFLMITVFHKKSETEWTTKVIGFSYEAQTELVRVIQENRKHL